MNQIARLTGPHRGRDTGGRMLRSRPAGAVDESTQRHGLASPEELIDEARNGRLFILVDDEDRENEGDLVIPAQMATPNAINFMATHGRGLICLALTRERVEQLELEPMSRRNEARHETAFTISIEAREGVTTGISAADRARTIAVAIDANRGCDDIASPGHVFPLQACDGGVLTRAGHTEAAVDVARLAGLNPSGVICEIMNEDGTMARLPDLLVLARKHGLKVGTIRDLIAYRRRYDRVVERRTEASFESRWGGVWKAITFFNQATGTEQLVIQKGEVQPDRPTLVRMHQLDPLTDAFGGLNARHGLISRSMEMISEHGSGVIVILNRRSPNAMSRLVQASGRMPDPKEMNEFRDYGVGAQILAELGIHEMILLTNSHHSLVALEGYGLTVVRELPVEA